MSGHKRAMISLSEADLRKLAQIDERLRVVETDYEEILRKSRQERESLLLKGLKELEDHQFGLVSKLESIDKDLAEIEFETSQIIYECLEDFQNQLMNQLDQQVIQIGNYLWSGVSNFLNQFQSEYFEFTAKNMDRLQEKFNNLLEDINNDQSIKQDAVVKIIQSCELMISSLLQDAELSNLFHDELIFIKTKLNYSNQNLENGFLESSLTLAQECYLELNQIYRKYEYYQWRHNALLSVAKEHAVKVLERCKKFRYIPAIDLNGNELSVQVDLDEWSDGRYCHLLEEITEIVEGLDKDEIVDEKELIRINDEILVEIDHQLDEIVRTVRYEILASQIRYNIAECVIQALLDQGFQLEIGTYKDENPKKEYQALLKHIDGSEVLIQISPENKLLGLNRIDIHSLDAEFRTEHELRIRAKEIAKSLEYFGLRIGNNTYKTPEEMHSNDLHIKDDNLEVEQVFYYGRN